MRSPRLYALGGVLAATALLAPQCARGGTDVSLYPSLAVFHKHEGPGTQQIPWVRAVGKAVIHVPPRGGTVTMTLWYRRTVASGWKFAGRGTIGNPWIAGHTKQIVLEYVCIYNKSWWKINFKWDGIAHDGTPDKGSRDWPSRLGVRETCIVYDTAASLPVPVRAGAR